MTWHRAGGAHPTDDGAGAQPREAVTPSPMGVGRAIARGGSAVARAAGIAAAILLLGTVVAGLLVEELLGSRDIDLLARGAMGSLGVLVGIAVLAEPLRLALERALLARDASRLPAGETPPTAERTALRAGPHGFLMIAGVAGIVLGAIGFPVGLLLAADDREALLARILVPAVGGALLLGGILLVRWSRARGRGRERWAAAHERLSARWGRAITPVPRAHLQRRHRILSLAGSAVTGGSMLFMAGVFMRQPGRFADPVEWGEAGERTIDGLLTTGAAVMGVALLAVLAVHGGLLLWTATRDGRTVRALERGDRVRLEHVDAVLLDSGPLERVAMVLGVAGWLVASYGWAPTVIAGIESAEATSRIQPLTALVAPGLAAVAVAWLLGAVGAARLRARRARVQAALLRDPRPAPPPASEQPDRRAEAVRDIALHAKGTILAP